MTTITIGIIGAGYSGTAFIATLVRSYPQTQFHFILIDKTNEFGLGHAYSTPYSHHLLNVKAKDMSAFEDEPMHFVKWLKQDAKAADQFIARKLYGNYLKELLQAVENHPHVTIQYEKAEVIDITHHQYKTKLLLADQRQLIADKVILAIGNNAPSTFPFPIAAGMPCIDNPWDYRAIEHIPKDAPVLIVGTGLSMIDAVLSLYEQQHQGHITALSRHGLLPLPHQHSPSTYSLKANELPANLKRLTRSLREKIDNHMQQQGNWRDVIGALRFEAADVWRGLTQHDKKRFIRHVMSYWNVHRHRVHDEISDLLQAMQNKQQLEIIAGRIQRVTDNAAIIKKRHHAVPIEKPVNYLINCMGPTLTMQPARQPLIKALVDKGYAILDALQLGFVTDEYGALKDAADKYSSFLYTIGPPRKGESWECTAVPDIRKQISELVHHIMQKEYGYGSISNEQTGSASTTHIDSH